MTGSHLDVIVSETLSETTEKHYRTERQRERMLTAKGVYFKLI